VIGVARDRSADPGATTTARAFVVVMARASVAEQARDSGGRDPAGVRPERVTAAVLGSDEIEENRSGRCGVADGEARKTRDDASGGGEPVRHRTAQDVVDDGLCPPGNARGLPHQLGGIGAGEPEPSGFRRGAGARLSDGTSSSGREKYRRREET